MPKLDLTPADTPEELENFIVYLLETSSRGSDEVSSFYDKFLNESKIELFVAETLDKLKVQAMNNMTLSFVEWQQKQSYKDF